MLPSRLTLKLLLLACAPVLANAEQAQPETPAGMETPAASETSPDEAAEAPPAGTIYLMARTQLTGTDFAQVALLHERRITTLEECEKERSGGLTTGWQAYRHYLQTYKGVAYKVDYRCVSSEQRISRWRLSQPQDQFYMVRSENQQLRLKSYDNFFVCRDALRAQGLRESVDSFCAKAGQRIVE